MNAAGRLSLYGAGVVVAFGAAFGIAAAVVPDSAVANWTAAASDGSMADHAGMTDTDTTETATIPGVSLSGYGYELSPITAPTGTGQAGEFSFQILDAADRLRDLAREGPASDRGAHRRNPVPARAPHV